MKLIKKGNYLVVCTLLIISAAINVCFAFVLQQIIDSTVSKNVSVLLQTIGFAVLFMFFDMLVTIASKLVAGKYIQDVLEQMKSRKFYSSLTSFIGDNNRSKSAPNMASFSTNIDIIENSYLQSRLNIVFYASQFIFGLIAMISINIMVTLGIAVITLIPMLLPKLFQNMVRRRKEAYSAYSGKYLAFINESLQGRYEIRDYGKTSVFMQMHDQVNHEMEDARFKSRFIDSTVSVMTQNFGFLTFITALGIGSYYVLKGEMTFGYMIAVVQLMNNLLQPLNYVTSSMNQINSSANIAADYTEPSKEVSTMTNSITSFNNHFDISNLSYSYDKGKPVIEHLYLHFKKGKKYAITGSSGCGKSTFAKILAGDIKDYEGQVMIDGHEIRQFEENDYRALIRYVRQDSFIFTDTLRNNILFYDESYDDDQLRDVVEFAMASSFAITEEQWNRHISNTDGLSGGQKQRVSLARALLRTPPILILDEITSSIDPLTTYEIYRNLVTNYKGTCIVITHQQEDRILQLFDEVISLSESFVETK